MSEINNLNVLFRFANENDYNYILKTIMKSIRYEPIYKEIRDVIYYKNIEAKIKKDLSTHNIILCVDKNDTTFIISFFVYKKIANNSFIFYFLHTRKNFRLFSIAKNLIKKTLEDELKAEQKNEYTLQTYLQKTANVIVVHKTAFVRSLENRYNLIYNPFIFFENK